MGTGIHYDGYGNLTGASPTVGSAPYFSTSFDGANHQIGTSYDSNGNPVSWFDASHSAYASMGYDVENRLVTAMDAGPWMEYTYDPSGKRVVQQQIVDSQVQSIQVYFYAITGQRLATYQASADLTTFNFVSRNLYFGGKLIRSAGKTVATDRLGSVRASFNVYGGDAESFSYWPYGQERTSTSDGREKFGTYFRDAPGQDYADQRYYNATLGRFWTPDPSTGVSLGDPSSLNKYAYVGGDPVNHYDPYGLFQCNPEYCTSPPPSIAIPDGGTDSILPNIDRTDKTGEDPNQYSLQGTGDVMAVLNLAHSSAIDDTWAGIRTAFANGSDCANWFNAGLMTSTNHVCGSIDNFLGSIIPALSGAGTFVGGSANAIATSPLTTPVLIAVNTKGAFFNTLSPGTSLSPSRLPSQIPV